MAEGGDFGYDDDNPNLTIMMMKTKMRLPAMAMIVREAKNIGRRICQPPPAHPQGDRTQAFFLARCDVYMDFGKLHPTGFSEKGNHSDVVQFGSKGGETKFSKVTARGFLKISQKDFQALWDQALKKYYSRRPWYHSITAPKIGGC